MIDQNTWLLSTAANYFEMDPTIWTHTTNLNNRLEFHGSIKHPKVGRNIPIHLTHQDELIIGTYFFRHLPVKLTTKEAIVSLRDFYSVSSLQLFEKLGVLAPNNLRNDTINNIAGILKDHPNTFVDYRYVNSIYLSESAISKDNIDLYIDIYEKISASIFLSSPWNPGCLNERMLYWKEEQLSILEVYARLSEFI